MGVRENVTNGAVKLMVDFGPFQRGFLFCFMEETHDERGYQQGFATAELADTTEDERGHSGHSGDDQRGFSNHDSPKSGRIRRKKSRRAPRETPE
jgi:hypothetical protein